MRYLIFLLLAANLGYYVWSLYHPVAVSRVPHYTEPGWPAGVQRLHLVKAAGAPSAPSPSSAAASGPAQSSGEPAAPAKPSAPGAVSRESEPRGGAAPAGPSSNGPSGNGAPAESAPSSGGASPAEGNGPQSRAEPARPKTACSRVGPLDSEDSARKLAGVLTGRGATVQLQSRQAQVPLNWWVFLPPRSADEARRIYRELSAQGLTDLSIGKDNAISLGIYNDEATARQRLDQISGFGYEPVVQQRHATRTRYWLAVQAPAAASLNDDQWQQLLSAYDGVERSAAQCP